VILPSFGPFFALVNKEANNPNEGTIEFGHFKQKT